MPSQKFRGELLCEDREQETFFRKMLERWFGKGRLYVTPILDKKGAGDDYVLRSYARAVRQARKWSSENYALVVAIDGDREKLHGRLKQLNQKLKEDGRKARGDDEKILVFVPTRNVETWELWLCGFRDVDEETNFKRRFQEAEARGEVSAREAAKAWNKPLSAAEKRLEEQVLSALAAGRLEIRRLDST